ncbi:MAG: hypothetical protein NTY20_05080 [Candidatus Aenigmarchaeota archaeon]|nr:hypothetical protein [Candidatus Aenigmarchaeota archaeon]
MDKRHSCRTLLRDRYLTIFEESLYPVKYCPACGVYVYSDEKSGQRTVGMETKDPQVVMTYLESHIIENMENLPLS